MFVAAVRITKVEHILFEQHRNLRIKTELIPCKIVHVLYEWEYYGTRARRQKEREIDLR
jgi:hypothetical protein